MAKVGDVGLGFGYDVSGAAPSAPTLTISVSGTTATATIAGDTGATNWLKYKLASASAWSTLNRAGDGDIEIAGLSTGARYTFVAVSQSAEGVYSLPSIPIDVLIQVSTTSALDAVLPEQADFELAAFGEPVTYYPKGGSSRDIIAIVDRNPVAGLDGVPHGTASQVVVKVKNDSDDGISSSEVNVGGDHIKFAVRIGKTATQKRIKGIQWEDAGMIYLEVA